ncbi:MAG: membrane dipeptidase [candidate division Zixibacteria bacterium]|nr:membrane dipeptidase [candidate division Zixibacteria bacterium]MDH3937479.1 membrane dipeptidase [candidate division Zixibacteria bacterium]MDH4035571.1 membrane dipeptidase [candidate division Zixibacteria bacterium]
MSYSRRRFVRLALSGLAGATGIGQLLSVGCRASRHLLEGVRPDRPVLADLHVHSMINQWNRQSALGVKYPLVAGIAEKFANKSGMEWEDCHAAGVDLICVAHFNVFDEWLSMPTDPNPEAPANSLRMLDHLERALQGPDGRFAKMAYNHDEMTSLLDVPKTSDAFRTCVVHTLEGGHALGGDLGAVETFAKRGVALITVTHFFNKGIASAANSYPFFPDAGAGWDNQGLTAFGREVIREMEDCGILVDITHAPAASVADILHCARLPLVATHVGARTLSDHPYSLYDEHIEQIAHDSGIIGVIIDPYLLSNYASIGEADHWGTLSDTVRNIRHIVKLHGTHKHVGIGSDFAGFINPPKEMTRLSQIDQLRRLLLDEFGDESVVADILARNAINFLKENWRSGL